MKKIFRPAVEQLVPFRPLFRTGGIHCGVFFTCGLLLRVLLRLRFLYDLRLHVILLEDSCRLSRLFLPRHNLLRGLYGSTGHFRLRDSSFRRLDRCHQFLRGCLRYRCLSHRNGCHSFHSHWLRLDILLRYILLENHRRQ